MDIESGSYVVEEVEGVRCCLLFTIIVAMGLVVDPLPKLLPGYFIAKILFDSWTMMEASNTKGRRDLKGIYNTILTFRTGLKILELSSVQIIPLL